MGKYMKRILRSKLIKSNEQRGTECHTLLHLLPLFYAFFLLICIYLQTCVFFTCSERLHLPAIMLRSLLQHFCAIKPFSYGIRIHNIVLYLIQLYATAYGHDWNWNFLKQKRSHVFGCLYFTTVNVVIIPPSGIYLKSNEKVIWRGINITTSQRFTN